MLKRSKRVIFFSLFIILLCVLLTYNNRGIEIETLQVYDYYDLPGYPSFSEVIKQNQSFERMKILYEKENKAKNFEYMEVYTTLLQYIGHYVNGNEFIYEYGHVEDEQLSEFINQKALVDEKEMEVTNIKGVLIGEKAFEKLEFSVERGEAFDGKDYESTGEFINVILGNNYSDIYEIGDKFTMLYMGEMIEVNVIGFLQKQSYIEIGTANLLIDSYVVMPSFDIVEDSVDISYKIRHYSNKTKGFMVIKGKENIDVAKREFSDILKEVDLAYFAESLD